jgi:hypothetical protein
MAMDALHQYDPVQALHEGDGETEPFVQQQVDRAVLAEQEQHGDGADEGRHDQRNDAEGLNQDGAAKIEPGGEIGQRQREDGRHDNRHGRDVEGV